MVDGTRVEVSSRNDDLDDLVHQVLPYLVCCDVVGVLNGDDDCVDSQWNAGSLLHAVFTSHLHNAESDVSRPWDLRAVY